MVDDLKISNKNKLIVEKKISKTNSLEIDFSSAIVENKSKNHQNMTIWSNNENENRNERFNLIRRSSNLNMSNSNSAFKEIKKSLADIPSQTTIASEEKKLSTTSNTSKIVQKPPSVDSKKKMNKNETELKARVVKEASIEDRFNSQTLTESTSNRSNLKLNVSTINCRPPTARSLPSKVPSEENDTTSGRLKNPSCPNILPPLAKLINVSTLDKDNSNLNDLNKQNETEKSLNKLSISSSISQKPSVPCSLITSNSPGSKSNLDYFLDITSNPFTTKFEIIGTENRNQRSPFNNNKQKFGAKPITGSNFSLKDIDNSSGIIRSQSISNLNDKLSVENIISPNLVKPYTTNDKETNSIATKSKNLSVNNLNSLNDDISGRYGNIFKPDSDEYSYITSGSNEESMKKNFLRITDHIFIGSMSSIKNERKMCRLGIEYLIDMTNMRPDDLNRQTLGKLPCLCKRQHSRLYLTLEVTETSFKNLFSAFSEVNKFIQMAKKTPNSKRVLIFGKEPLSQKVICACAQYLMVEYEMDMDTALQVILQKNNASNKIKIEKCYLNYLQQFQSYLNHLSVNLYGTSQANGKSNTPENEKCESGNRGDLGLNTDIIKNRKINKLFEYDENDDEDFDGSNDSNEYENSDIIDHLGDNKSNTKTQKIKCKKNNSDSDDFYEEENFTRLAKKGPVKFSKLQQSGANEIESNLNKNNNSEHKMAWM